MVAIVMTVLLHHIATPAIMHQGTLTVGYEVTILRWVLHADTEIQSPASRLEWCGGRARLLRGDFSGRRHHREVEADRVL